MNFFFLTLVFILIKRWRSELNGKGFYSELIIHFEIENFVSLTTLILSQKNQIYFYFYSKILFRSDQFFFEISHSVYFEIQNFITLIKYEIKKSEFLRILIIPINIPNLFEKNFNK